MEPDSAARRNEDGEASVRETTSPPQGGAVGGGRPVATGCERAAPSPKAEECGWCGARLAELRYGPAGRYCSAGCAEAGEPSATAPSPQGQECAGLLILADLHAIAYVDGVPCIGVPGKLRPATAREVAWGLRYCELLAEELADLHAWTREAMRRLKREEKGEAFPEVGR